MANDSAAVGLAKPADAHSAGPHYVTVLRGSNQGPSGTPYIELDPNNFKIRFNPPLDTGTFLPNWTLVDGRYPSSGGTRLGSYNVPGAGTAPAEGARVTFDSTPGSTYDVGFILDAVKNATSNLIVGDVGRVESAAGAGTNGVYASSYWSARSVDTSGTYVYLSSLGVYAAPVESYFSSQQFTGATGSSFTTLLGARDRLGNNVPRGTFYVASALANSRGLYYETDVTASGYGKFGIFSKGDEPGAVVQQHVTWTGTDADKLALLGIALEAYGWIIRDL